MLSAEIQHINEIAILKDILDFPACQQVFDVLRDTRGDAAPFSETLPDFNTVCGRLLFL